MCAEAIIFNYSTPVSVDHFRALHTRANTIAPVVLIGKAAAGPAQVRYFNAFEGVNNIQPDAVLLLHRQIFIYPKATVNTMAKVLGKVAVNVPANGVF